MITANAFTICPQISSTDLASVVWVRDLWGGTLSHDCHLDHKGSPLFHLKQKTTVGFRVHHPPRADLLGIHTWLILPAIICLSQRLSHACLSISNYTAKLRTAHYISYNLLDDSVTWITVGILELIHVQSPDQGQPWEGHTFENRDQDGALTCGQPQGPIVTVDSSKIMWTEGLSLWWCKRVSALSTFNRSVGDYGGCNGYGELGFDSGEVAWETATTSKEGSRRVNYPIPIRGDSDKKYWCRAFWVLLSEWVQCKNISEEQLEGKSGEQTVLCFLVYNIKKYICWCQK